MPVPYTQVIFKERDEFLLRKPLPDDAIQVDKDHVILVSDIVRLAQSPIYINSIDLMAFSSLTGLIEFAKFETSPATHQFYVSEVYNGYVVPGQTPQKKWGLSAGILVIQGSNITIIPNVFECTVTINQGEAEYNGWQPTSSRLFTGTAYGIKYQISLNLAALGDYWSQGTRQVYQYSESLFSPLCYEATVAGYGYTALAVTQQFFTQASNVYNINAFYPDFVGKLSEAVTKVPNTLKKKGLNLTFKLLIRFKASAYPERAVTVTYLYQGDDLTSTNWENLDNWQGLTPVILTVSEYELLQTVEDNTLYYLKEDET